MFALAAAAFLVVAAPDVQAAQAEAIIEVSVKNGKLEGARTVRAKHGDAVTLRVMSDRRITLHLHGYDIERSAEPATPAIFSFIAKATGRFAMEEHISDAAKTSHGHAPALFYLEILPK